MTDTTPLADEPQGTHFWFMTVQTPNNAGAWLAYYQGTRTPRPGQTRQDLFNAILTELPDGDPRTTGAVVLAFDIQPNQL